MNKANSKTAPPTTTLTFEYVAVNITLFYHNSKLFLIFFPIAFKRASNGKATRLGVFEDTFVVVKGTGKRVPGFASPNFFQLEGRNFRG
jgi:hypothetical protein